MTEEETKVKDMFKFLDTITPGPWLLYSNEKETKFYIMQQSPIGLTTVCIVERRKDAEAIIILRNQASHHILMSSIFEESNKFMTDKMYICNYKDAILLFISTICINFYTLAYGYPWYMFILNILLFYFLVNFIINRKAIQYFNQMSNFVSNFKQ